MPWCSCEVKGPLLRAVPPQGPVDGTLTARVGGKCLLACPDTVIIKKLSCFNDNLEAIKKSQSHKGGPQGGILWDRDDTQSP